jgi:hypothetical protein
MAYTEPGTNTNRVVETFAIADDRDRIRWGQLSVVYLWRSPLS